MKMAVVRLLCILNSMLSLHYEDTPVLDLSLDFLEPWLVKVCDSFGNSLDDLNIIFCSDEYLLEMNRSHLNHDYYTDIITFDYCVETNISGDLFISVDRVLDNADDLSLSFELELKRVIVHGVLHLNGLKDKSDEDAADMRSAENEMLALLN